MVDEDPIVLANEAVRVMVLPLGATLWRFEMRLPDGTWRNIVLGHPTAAHYRTGKGYLGATVGRFANRIGGARFELDGAPHELDANEAPNTLHGGSGGFSTRMWNVVESGPTHVELGLISADGDQGFPGTLTARARFELIPGGAQVTYTATTDAATVVNLTTHPYFNLDGEAAGSTDAHRLLIHASAYTPTGDDGIPTGEIRPVAGTAADFRTGPELGAAREAALAEGITRGGGFDHNFVVDGTGLREHCRLSGAAVSLTIRSDQPALQVYGGAHFDGVTPGASGVPYVQWAGVALETQGFPDAPNQPGFPATVLRPGQEYRATTQWLLDQQH